MKWTNDLRERGLLTRRIVAGVGLALYLFTANPATLAQTRRSSEHWVGSGCWS